MTKKAIEQSVPQLKPLASKSRKEVWFEEGTILSLIAGCIEVIEGGTSANDTEMVGLLYGKPFKTEPGLPQNRYYIRRGYIIQNAKREGALVSYDTWAKEKMDSFFRYNLGDIPLGSFHLHPKGSSRLSRKDKLYRFEPGQLKFLIYLKEKSLIKDDIGSGTGLQITAVDDKYEHVIVRCKVKLKRDKGGPKDFYVRFGILGWYRYDLRGEKRFAPVSIMII